MKKKLLVVLVIVLCAALCFTACKENPHSVVITCNPIRLPAGTSVNWGEYVSVTVDGVKVDNPKIDTTLTSGDPSQEGNATYTLSYDYEGQPYTTIATVEFYRENNSTDEAKVEFVSSAIQVNVGQTVNWSSYVTVKVDGTVKADLQLTPSLVSGNPQVAGQCVYKLSVTIEGKTYTSNSITVTYTDETKDPVVVITCPRFKVDVGETPDWKSNVKVTVDGTEVQNPTVVATLDNGSATTAGAAVYVLSFTYSGKEYTQPVTIDFVAVPEVRFSCEPFAHYIGEQINWAAKAVPIVDGGTVSNPQITAELISGNPEVEGECEYKLTFTYQSRKYTCNAAVTYSVSPVIGETEGKALEAMLAKQYTSLKFTYRYEVPEDDSWINQVELVQGANYFVTYTFHIPSLADVGKETDVNENYYLEVNTTTQTIRLVYKVEDENKWYYQVVDFEQAIEEDLAPYMFTMADYASDLKYEMFEKVGVNTYKASDRYLVTVAGAFLDLTTTTPESVIIKTDGENVIELKLTYTDTDSGGDFKVIQTCSWTDFDDTTVEIPNAEQYVAPVEKPEFPDPSQATALTDEETAKLTAALAKTYGKVSYGYDIDSGSSYFNLTFEGTFDSTLQRGYYFYKEWTILSGTNPSTGEAETEEWIYDSAEYYVKQLTESLAMYQMIGSDYVYGTTNQFDYSAWQTANYVAVADIALTADMFGKLDNWYVVKADKLEEVYALINEVMSLEGESFAEVTLQTCLITLDAQNNVTELYFVLNGTSGGKELYKQCTLTYKNFDTATVVLPDDKQLQDLTADQTAAMQAALGADYSNVTITESVSESIFKFDGDEVLALEHLESQYKYDETPYINIEGTWYKKLGQETESLTQPFEQLVLTFDFTKLDVTTAQYNALNGTYYFAMTHEQILQFAQYYYNFAEIYEDSNSATFGGFKAVVVTVEDNNVTKVTLVADEMTVSSTFIDYGTTVLTQDEADA